MEPSIVETTKKLSKTKINNIRMQQQDARFYRRNYILKKDILSSLAIKTRRVRHLSNFNSTNVTDMRKMFFNCKFLTSLDLSNFSTTNNTNTRGIFRECKFLTKLSQINIKKDYRRKTSNERLYENSIIFISFC